MRPRGCRLAAEKLGFKAAVGDSAGEEQAPGGTWPLRSHCHSSPKHPPSPLQAANLDVLLTPASRRGGNPGKSGGLAHSPCPLRRQKSPPLSGRAGCWPCVLQGRPDPTAPTSPPSLPGRTKVPGGPPCSPPEAPEPFQPLGPQPPHWCVYLRLDAISGSSLIFCGCQSADHLCLSSTK